MLLPFLCNWSTVWRYNANLSLQLRNKTSSLQLISVCCCVKMAVSLSCFGSTCCRKLQLIFSRSTRRSKAISRSCHSAGASPNEEHLLWKERSEQEPFSRNLKHAEEMSSGSKPARTNWPVQHNQITRIESPRHQDERWPTAMRHRLHSYVLSSFIQSYWWSPETLAN